MPNFQHFTTEAQQLETEIFRKGIVIGIDWNNEAQVRDLARQALSYHGDAVTLNGSKSPEVLAKVELFGLAHLMLKLMTQSAEDGLLTHGGQVWKTFAKALWEEMNAAK